MPANWTTFPIIPTNAALYVIVRVGQRGFALPLQCVDRALRMAACTPVPDGPAWLVGLLNVAGQILPVYDLGLRLGGASQPTPAHRLLLAHSAGRLVALMVDEVAQVTELAANPEPLPPMAMVTAAHRLGDEIILVLDPDQLLPAEASG